MELSERGLQRKQLNADYKRILNERVPVFSEIKSTDELHSSLKCLARELCEVYLSYPLLCGRFSEMDDPSSDEEEESFELHTPTKCQDDRESAECSLAVELQESVSERHASHDGTVSNNDSQRDGDGDGLAKSAAVKKKPKARKQKHNPIRQQLRMGMTIKEIQKGGAMNVPAAAQRQGFARALAVCYNKQTDTLTCGMSGKLRKVRIHPLIWGKSVEPGRPRGTCAEFKVVNQALVAGEAISDLVIHVVDIGTGQPKPRCRNCVLVTQPATVLSDSL